MSSRPTKRRKNDTLLEFEDTSANSRPLLGFSGTSGLSVELRQTSAAEDNRIISSSVGRTDVRNATYYSAKPTKSVARTNSNERSKKGQILPHNGGQNGSLRGFFKVVDTNRDLNGTHCRASLKDSKKFEDDEIEDDIPEDISLAESGNDSEHPVHNINRNRIFNSGLAHEDESKESSARPESQLDPSVHSSAIFSTVSPGSTYAQSCVPWVERYPPRNLDELAVHKKKLTEVQGWLKSIACGVTCKRLLVLRGPPGSGKTATIKALAATVGFDLVEWRNPIGKEYTPHSFVSLSAQFEEFLSRNGRYRSLVLTDSESVSAVRQEPTQTQKKIILIEEFPHISSNRSMGLSSFRASVLSYLALSSGPQASAAQDNSLAAAEISPVIMVITESQNDSAVTMSECVSAYRLLGPDILHHPGVNMITFNSVAPTFLKKALHLVMQREARESGRVTTLGPAALSQLSTAGDLRSAITSLEFLCIGGKQASSKEKRKTKMGFQALNKSHTLSNGPIEMSTQRETGLDLFHAVGKVVYNKRRAISTTGSVEVLAETPDHLRHLQRPMTSEVDVEQLANETAADMQTFIAALHENYVLSCEGCNFVDAFNGCIDSLSDSDILDSVVQGTSGFYDRNSADMLRQTELSFITAVRGLLFQLPSPVKRRNERAHSLQSSAREGYKMFYPRSMRTWKLIAAVNDLVDNLIIGLEKELRIQTSSEAAQSHNMHDLIREQGSRIVSPTSCTSEFSNRGFEMPMCTYSRLSREELLLQQLPFLARIRQNTITSPSLQRDLLQLTRFGEPSANEEIKLDETGFDEDEGSDSAIVTKLGFGASHANAGSAILGTPSALITSKWVLSDDDIEDD